MRNVLLAALSALALAACSSQENDAPAPSVVEHDLLQEAVTELPPPKHTEAAKP